MNEVQRLILEAIVATLNPNQKNAVIQHLTDQQEFAGFNQFSRLTEAILSVKHGTIND